MQPIARDGPSGVHENYWRILIFNAPTIRDMKERLDKHGFYYKKSSSLVRLVKLVQRCERGLLSYEGYTVAELRRFAHGRGLQDVAKMPKNELVERLEAVDDGHKFPETELSASAALRRMVVFRLLDLPPEIRNQIYTTLFKSFGALPQGIAQPPICGVSRQTRTESLGLFYEHSTFPFDLEIMNYRPSKFWFRIERDPSMTSFSPQCLRFLSGVSASNLAHIKHLSITLRTLTDTPRLRDIVTWNINLTTGQCIISKSSPAVSSDTITGRHAMQKGGVTEKSLQLLVDAIMARNGLEKLRPGDLETLARSGWLRMQTLLLLCDEETETTLDDPLSD